MHISPGLDEHTFPPPTLALHISWRIRIRQNLFFSIPLFTLKLVRFTFFSVEFLVLMLFFFPLRGGELGILSSWIFSVLCRAFPI